jgi:DNA-directed RNA polymerase subunit RPC12/RpoP
MADIDIICPNCSKVMTASEFADPQYLTCPSCGHKIGEKAASSQTTAAHQPLVFRKQWDVKADKPGEPAPPAEWRFHKHTAHSQVEKKTKMTYAIRSWVIFLVFGGLMAYWRYGSHISPQAIAQIRLYGPWIMGVIVIIITLEAYRDSVFQGVLSTLLFFFYPFYYLFAVSDRFYMRAFIAGILIAIGKDSFEVFNEVVVRGVGIVQNWIAHGGS